MTDRPIHFSAPMILALLAGTKSQTRRLVRHVPDFAERVVAPGPHAPSWMAVGQGMSGGVAGVRFAVGDRLWVREHWRASYNEDYHEDTATQTPKLKPPRNIPPGSVVEYLATDEGELNGRDRRAMHMPRWASRLTLHVTNIRVERLQEISEADALAEGIVQHGRFFGLEGADWDDAELSAREAYGRLWRSINGETSWDENPWVVAVSFSIEHCNVSKARP